MKLPLQLHFAEFQLRLYYFLFSITICLLITLSHHESILFLETYNFSFLEKKNFIATHVAELFSSSLYVNMNLVLIINFPYGYYHCINFLNTGWYKSQLWYFSAISMHTFLGFILGMLICYFHILPYAFAFLDTWSITTNHALNVQLEARIETYVCWTLQTTCFLSNMIFLLYFKLVYSYLADEMISLHIFFRANKKYFIFFICLFTSMCVPPESFIQIVFILSAMILIELFFLATCLFFSKNNV